MVSSPLFYSYRSSPLSCPEVKASRSGICIEIREDLGMTPARGRASSLSSHPVHPATPKKTKITIMDGDQARHDLFRTISSHAYHTQYIAFQRAYAKAYRLATAYAYHTHLDASFA